MTSVTFLQQTSAAQLCPANAADVTLSRVFPAEPNFNARMYREVGGNWNWKDRLSWSDGRWSVYASDPAITTFRALNDGKVAGFAELRMSPASEVTATPDGSGVEIELVYFGLLPCFAGRGLGGWFLSEVCRMAWDVPGVRRVWLHTCDDDSPAAIPNYLARGFVAYARKNTGCAACTA